MVRKIFLQCRPGHPLLQLIHVVAAKFAKRCRARGRDWVQSGRRSIGPSVDQGLDLLQLDRLAPLYKVSQTEKVKYASCQKHFLWMNMNDIQVFFTSLAWRRKVPFRKGKNCQIHFIVLIKFCLLLLPFWWVTCNILTEYEIWPPTCLFTVTDVLLSVLVHVCSTPPRSSAPLSR